MTQVGASRDCVHTTFNAIVGMTGFLYRIMSNSEAKAFEYINFKEPGERFRNILQRYYVKLFNCTCISTQFFDYLLSKIKQLFWNTLPSPTVAWHCVSASAVCNVEVPTHDNLSENRVSRASIIKRSERCRVRLRIIYCDAKILLTRVVPTYVAVGEGESLHEWPNKWTCGAPWAVSPKTTNAGYSFHFNKSDSHVIAHAESTEEVWEPPYHIPIYFQLTDIRSTEISQISMARTNLNYN